jgi:hypothetical protein
LSTINSTRSIVTRGSWMIVDVGATRRISPNHYSLKHGKHGGQYIRNWVLEGKMNESDTSSWVVLKKHVNDDEQKRHVAGQ